MEIQFTAVTRMQLNQAVERILHVPGNYSAGSLEMTVVIDMALPDVTRTQVLTQIARSLKQHSAVFQNVRLNLVKWKDDSVPQNEVIPLIQLTIPSYCEKMQGCVENDKHASYLMEYLKKFHARSKLILIVTDGSYIRSDTKEDEQRLKQALEPFLGKKFARVMCKGENVTIEGRMI